MITITKTDDIAAAYEQSTNHKGAYATCRILDNHQPDCQEWAEHCEIAGVPATIYYIFDDADCQVEDASDMLWDAKNVSKIEMN